MYVCDFVCIVIPYFFCLNFAKVQQVRLGSHTWEKILKGVPQGSILGPLLFNVFLNDIFLFINEGVTYNYADDNTVFLFMPTQMC